MQWARRLAAATAEFFTKSSFLRYRDRDARTVCLLKVYTIWPSCSGLRPKTFSDRKYPASRSIILMGAGKLGRSKLGLGKVGLVKLGSIERVLVGQ